jgi:hypothetical protein
MRRIKIEMILASLGCIIVGVTLICIMLYNYRAFTALPPFSVSQKTIDSLREIAFNDMKFIAFIGVVWLLIGFGVFLIFLRLKKYDSA